MNHGSLFSGIGGFDLAAEWMGWQNVFHCEWNEFGQKVLKHYWPKAISYHDITKTDFTIHRGQIDILTGGFPCQPYSMAGKRKGREDERHLWPEMLRAIREIQPRWVVGENVFGLVNWSGGLVFHEVQADLEAAGYEVFPYVLPAVSVNAPHRRDRVWFVAKNTNSNGRRSEQRESQTGEREQRNASTGDNERLQTDNAKTGVTADTKGLRINRAQEHENGDRQGGERRGCDINNIGEVQGGGVAANTGLLRQEITKKQTARVKQCNQGDAANTLRQRLEGGMRQEREESEFFGVNTSAQNSQRIRGTWQNFPTQSPICSGDDELSRQLDGITFPKWRNESIKAYGNAVVPALVYQIFKAIEQYKSLPCTSTPIPNPAG